jgi:hypothetical protein
MGNPAKIVCCWEDGPETHEPCDCSDKEPCGDCYYGVRIYHSTCLLLDKHRGAHEFTFDYEVWLHSKH